MNAGYLRARDISYTGVLEENVVEAEGIRTYTDSGEVYYNFNEITIMLGYNNRKFVERVKAVVERGITTPVSGYEEYKINLFNKLFDLTRGDFDKIFLSSSGSESIDWAARIARNFTGKDRIVAFNGSLHGRTYLSACLSGIDRRKKDFGVQAPEIIHVDYPSCASCKYGECPETCSLLCIEEMGKQLEDEEIAGIIVEPFTGSTGMVFPPAGYMKRLCQWAKKRNVVVIADEIQTAFGKTGQMFRYQSEEMEPDVLVLGKAMGNGMHISGLLAKNEVLGNLDGTALAGGTGSNPVCVEAACAVIDIIAEDKLLAHTREIEAIVKPQLQRMVAEYSVIRSFRGEGVAYGIEFSGEDGAQRVKQTIIEAKKTGLLLGCSDNVLFFRPPLSVTAEEARLFVDTLERIIREM